MNSSGKGKQKKRMMKTPSQTKSIGAFSFSGGFRYPLNLVYDPSTRKVTAYSSR